MKYRVSVISVITAVFFVAGMEIDLLLMIVSIYCLFFLTNFLIKEGDFVSAIISYAFSMGCCVLSLVNEYSSRILFLYILFSLFSLGEALWHRTNNKL